MITIPREVNYFKETVSDLLAQCQRITSIDKVSALLVFFFFPLVLDFKRSEKKKEISTLGKLKER